MSHLIVWKDSFSVDGGLIDEDHRYLIYLINEILEAMKDGHDREGIRHDVAELRRFARLHFDREELLQSLAGFDEAAPHGLLHTDLIDQLDDALAIVGSNERLDACEASGEELGKCSQMRTFFYRWLLVHILKEDMKMRPYVNRMRSAWSRFPPLQSGKWTPEAVSG